MSLRISFASVSLVRQGKHRFYSLTMPSEVLAETCFVISRDEDPKVGFQRELEKKRAKEIAVYIDSELGTIPSSIVLSAQEDADLIYSSKNKSLSFKQISKAFLILDGQHRVYGFSLAEKAIRVPVVIYEKLSRRDESRLFIDINSKQKGVPPELLLDIKKLAEYETGQEELFREIFDMFYNDHASSLYGRLSSAKKSKKKISRSTFNVALKPIAKIFGGKDSEEVYKIINNYIVAFDEAVLKKNGLSDSLTNATVFKAILNFFPITASKCKDTYGAIYSVDDLFHTLDAAGNKVKKGVFENNKNAYKPIVNHLELCLKESFTL